MILTDFILTAASTATSGNTLTLDGDTVGTTGVDLFNQPFVAGTILLLFIIAHLLDRKYSYNLYQESKLKKEEVEE